MIYIALFLGAVGYVATRPPRGTQFYSITLYRPAKKEHDHV
jgi:hypothetical protein